MENPRSFFAKYPGRTYFPRNPNDLTSTVQCPACFSTLQGGVCTSCGLDLNHPVAGKLAAVSANVAALLEERLELIGQIRFETDQLLAERAAAAASTAAAAAAPVVAPGEVPLAAPASPPAAASTPAAPKAPRRSSVQVLLLVVGVSLLSIAAIFFLVYAYINFGLIWQSVIIGAITIAAFAVASILRRRNLRGTAEGIAVFAVVLVYLDAYAIRANNLFNAQSADGLTYWGTALLVSAAVFIIWNRLSGLRVASLAGFAAIAPGAGLLVAGLTEPLQTGTRTFIAFAAIATAGLVHPFAVRIAEKVIALSISFTGFVLAFFVGLFIEPSNDWAAAYALTALAIVAGLHVAVIVRLTQPARATAAFTRIFAGAGGASAALAFLTSAFRIDQQNFSAIAPVVAAITVALALNLVRLRTRSGLVQQSLRVASISALAVSGALFLIPLFTVLVTIAGTVWGAFGANTWRTSLTGALLSPPDGYPSAIIAIALVIAITVVFALLTGQLRARRVLYLSALLAFLIVAAPLFSTVLAVTIGWFAIGVVALAVVLISLRIGRLSSTTRTPFVLTALIASLLGYAVSWASEGSWLIGSIVLIAVFIGLRSSVRRDLHSWRGTFLAIAIFIGFIAAAAGARALSADHAFTLPTVLGSVRFVGLLATVLLAVAAVPRLPGVSRVDRTIVFWMTVPTAVLAGAITAPLLVGRQPTPWAGAVLPEFTSSVVAGGAFVIAAVLWAVLRSTASFTAERFVASVLIAPALWWLSLATVRDFDLPTEARGLAPIIVTLVVAGVSLLLAVTRTTPPPRLGLELGVALVGAIAVDIAVTENTGTTWLVLLLAAVTTLILSISADGLFASTQPRKHLGWLALALGTAGLWWRLSGARIDNVEAFVLPLAGALLIIAVLIWRAAARTGTASKTAPWISLAALLVAVLPVAANVGANDTVRAIVIGGASAALLLTGSLFAGRSESETRSLRPYLDGAVLAGAAGVVIVTIGRGFALSNVLHGPDTRLDVWIGASLVILVLAAFGLAKRVAMPGYAGHRVAATALVIIGMVLVLFFANSNLVDLNYQPTTLGTIRAITVIALFSAGYVIAMIVCSPPLTLTSGWVAISFAFLTFLIGLNQRAIDPLEFGTVPIAIALLAGGAIRLARVPAARSWLNLAPGLLVLFVPSLLATISDRPVWRLVAIGVVGVAVIVIGVVRRLQAPFVIGVVVVLVHGIATFLPQIRFAYQALPWWLWAGFGGVLLIVLAARYEHRIKNLKDAALRLSSLR